MVETVVFPRAVPRERTVYVRKRLGVEDLKQGARYEIIRTARYWDILLTALVSGDFNRLHWSSRFARTAGHRTVVAHGIVLIGFLSAAIARVFAHGCMVSGIDAKFKRPICAGDEVHIMLHVASVNRRGRVIIEVEVKNNRTGEDVASGSCDVWLARPT